MKIRLYRGPFNGKVLEHPGAGSNEIIIRGPKPMSRKEKWEFTRDFWQKNPGLYYDNIPESAFPILSARYRLVFIPQRMYSSSLNNTMATTVATHPDGSIFYEWVNPRKS